MKNEFHTKDYYTKQPSFYDQSMNCRCWHPYYTHQLCVGKCDAKYCICTEFKYGSIEIWDFKRENKSEIEQRRYEGGLF